MNRNGITRMAFAIVLVCFLLSTFVSMWSLKLIGDQNTRELSRVLAARIYDTISSELSEPIHVARGMAHDSFLIDTLAGEKGFYESDIVAIMRRYLSGLKDGLEYEAAFVVSDITGRYYAFNGLTKIVRPGEDERDIWYQEFKDSGKAYDLDVDRDEVSADALTVFVNARLEGQNGELLGVCGVGVEMRGTQALFSELEQEYGVKLNLIDGQGLIQVDTDESKIDTAFPLEVRTDDRADYVFERRGWDHLLVTKYVENLGWTLVVQSDGRAVRAMLINIILLNLILCAVVMVILLLAIRIIAQRTRALANASFRDQTTQLLNRRAFEEEKGERLAAVPDVDFIYLTADINGLKTANDTLGHAAGDELILGAAQCLKECFGKYGNIYRIGGDEFAAMLTLTQDELTAAMERFERMTAEWKGERVDGLSVSLGYATGREHPSENISELGRISDEMMYAAKEAHYRETGKKRRTN